MESRTEQIVIEVEGNLREDIELFLINRLDKTMIIDEIDKIADQIEDYFREHDAYKDMQTPSVADKDQEHGDEIKEGDFVQQADYAVHPRETLVETIAGKGSFLIGLVSRYFNSYVVDVISGNKRICPRTADEFEKALNVPAYFWLNLQKNYDEAVARLEKEKSNSDE